MKIIDRRTSVTFMKPVKGRSTTGQVIETWTQVSMTFAKVDYSEADATGHDRDVLQRSVSIICRPALNVFAGYRAVIDNVSYNIDLIKHLSRTMYSIEATQVVD